jgi:hypothetical protein
LEPSPEWQKSDTAPLHCFLFGQDGEDKFETAFNHDEFFQKEEDVPVSETFACKKILYSPVGTSAVKVKNNSF